LPPFSTAYPTFFKWQIPAGRFLVAPPHRLTPRNREKSATIHSTRLAEDDVPLSISSPARLDSVLRSGLTFTLHPSGLDFVFSPLKEVVPQTVILFRPGTAAVPVFSVRAFLSSLPGAEPVNFFMGLLFGPFFGSPFSPYRLPCPWRALLLVSNGPLHRPQ